MQLQMIELERLSRLRRHLVPTVGEVQDDTKPHGAPRRKEITIVFSDIRNFTQMSDQLDPEDVKGILDEYLTQMTDVVFRNGGTVNKFVGDGVMFFFGDSTPMPDHALRGVRAALEMRDRARSLSASFHARLPEPFTVGLGIHTGPATVGNLGNWQQLEYTAVGSSVNLAARLQGLSKNSEVIASASTYGPLRERIGIRNERRETVRGFAHPIQVAEVIELRS
jgi:class 3 adenylate cyclase